MADVIKLDEAARPDFTERQRTFAKELVGLGLTRLTIISLALGKDAAALNHAEVAAGMTLIEQLRKELGYGIMDARRAGTPFMASAVREAARRCHLRVRIA